MHPNLTVITRISGIVLCSILLSHCASNAPQQQSRVESRDITVEQRTINSSNEQSDQSTPYENQRYNLERAEYYKNLATDGSKENLSQINAILSAAEHYIQANDFRQAKQAADNLNDLNIGSLSLQQANRYDIIRAYVAYSNNDFNVALDQLSNLLNNPQNHTEQSKTQLVDAWLLSSFCYQATGDYDAAISALIQRENLLVGQARAETTRYTWQVINQLSIEQRQVIMLSTVNAIVRNRLEQSLQGQYGNQAEQPAQFNQWREPTTSNNKQTIQSDWNQSSPKRIAVLLPITSKFQKAAQAVMDGIKYQHELNESPLKPTLSFYDIGDNPYTVTRYYTAALQAGADMVIGPLGKDYANQLSNYTQQNGSQPTILLGGDSYLNSSSRLGSTNNVSRLTMNPERDGIAVADRAQSLGYVTAALLVPNTSHGQRASAAFSQRWLNGGGNISNTTYYSVEQFDHSTELKQLFNINESEYRLRQLSSTLGFKPKFQAYRRSDIDFIFMLADNKAGRIVRPQINFFSGHTIPVFASSAIFNGIQNSTNNLDLERTHFPIMPWVLQSENISPYAGQLNMLFAMGSDAYQIAANYNTLRANSTLSISGNMGMLYIEASGEVIYQPVWAKFKNGIAEAGIDLLPVASPNSIGSRRLLPGGQRRQPSGTATYDDSNWNPRQSSRKNR